MKKSANMREKVVFAPNYFGKFRCIADKCRHSCCIDWEICIDKLTYEKYKQIGNIIDTITECEDGLSFALTENGRCPHLNESGLCNIILAHGEELLSDICRNHPRFFNDVGFGRIEAGLGIVCEEACRLILENETPFSLDKIETVYDDEPIYSRNFDPIPQRDRIISILETLECGFDEKLATLRSEFDIPEFSDSDDWLERLLSLEILDETWECDLRSTDGNLLQADTESSARYGKYYEQLLIYFVYRHVSIAEGRDDLRARLGFALLSMQVIRSLFEASSERSLEKLIDTARRYSAEIEYSPDNTDELIYAVRIKIGCQSD